MVKLLKSTAYIGYNSAFIKPNDSTKTSCGLLNTAVQTSQQTRFKKNERSASFAVGRP